MKRLTINILSLLILTGALSASNIANDPGLQPYVFPANASVYVSRPAYSSDGLSYLALSDDGKKIKRFDTRSGNETETVLDVDHTRENTIGHIEDFTLSPDGSKILVSTGRKMVYRRSYLSKNYIYEIRTRRLIPISEKFDFQQAPLFSPDGRMVAFVAEDNNIHLFKADYGTEVDVTTDGAKGKIINGVPDWVYEEEFSTSVSMAWAPDNLTLCYLKYNETDVPSFSFPLYSGYCHPNKQYDLYPGSFNYKYPVAGQPNSKVTLHSYDIDNRKTKDLSIPGGNFEYIPRIAYGGTPERLMTVTLNRAQNRMELFCINPRSGVGRSMLVEQSDAWLSPATYEEISFRENEFAVISTRSGYAHIYLYTYTGALSRTLTSGAYNVTAYYGADAKSNHYMQSTVSGSLNRVISRIDAKGNIHNLSPDTGTASAWFTPAMNFYTLIYNNSRQPSDYTLYSVDGKKIRLIEDNASTLSRFRSIPAKEFITIPNADGEMMNAYIIRPAGFDSSKKYPVIMYQYSGPGSQEVRDSWSVDWQQYAAMKGYIVICVDGRGTGGRERSWETVVYKNLGYYETLDQQAAARWIASQPFADADRIGICGWSYGGYETLMAVSTPSVPFAAAVAIAPVTDWRFYDTIYAERYMLTPNENEDGYEASAPLNHTSNLTVPLLVMHGTADDNVHFSNTVEYVSALQGSGKWCDLFIYPNMNHSINGCGARLSVYSRMLAHFDNYLK